MPAAAGEPPSAPLDAPQRLALVRPKKLESWGGIVLEAMAGAAPEPAQCIPGAVRMDVGEVDAEEYTADGSPANFNLRPPAELCAALEAAGVPRRLPFNTEASQTSRCVALA